MKEKIFTIIQTISMYLLQIFFLLACLFEDKANVFVVMFFVFIFITMIMVLLNIISGIISIFKGRTNPFKFTIVIKSILVPWYIVNFVIWALLIIGSLNPFLMMAIPLFLFISVCFTYICMISTSTLNISYIFNQVFFKRNIRINGGIVVGTIFEFIFCLDIIGSVILPIMLKRQLLTNL